VNSLNSTPIKTYINISIKSSDFFNDSGTHQRRNASVWAAGGRAAVIGGGASRGITGDGGAVAGERRLTMSQEVLARLPRALVGFERRRSHDRRWCGCRSAHGAGWRCAWERWQRNRGLTMYNRGDDDTHGRAWRRSNVATTCEGGGSDGR
jgi:hypothetical protein